MSEREMLERAAVAAGLPPADGYSPDVGLIWLRKTPGVHRGTVWSSYHDDGDALRLAVRLRLELIPLEGGGVDVQLTTESEPFGVLLATECSSDPYAATRLAITRAAAALAPTAPDVAAQEKT